mgnify:FL=1|jgi:phosphoribosyl-ATP pyrophosphohydrolase/phosphoribosyl-AMP cyclohydrolase|tara:strand:- start:20733 stop:21341 length:609 start_codon:yes stop_codon:yes gene_type:complete
MNPNFKQNTLLPAIIQNYENNKILMLGWMNEEAFNKTIESKNVWFFSRSKNRLWEKGESSKNYLRVKQILLDCDQDSILVNVKPEGPTCHTLNNSCFENEESINFKSNFSLEKLESIINKRKKENTKNSYTNKLFDEGIKKIGKKIGEEATEVIIASLAEKKEDLIYESADLIYHLLVLLANEEIKFEKVIKELEKRNNEPN